MPEVEGVVLITANHTHRELCVAAAKAGKHVLVDKPIANTLADAAAMYKACKKHKVLLAVGHNTRREWVIRKMKSLVDSGKMGDITMVEGNFSHPGGLSLSPKQWRWYKDKCPSGPLIQLGVHNIDAMQYLLGPVKSVWSVMRKLVVKAEIDDTTMSVFEFESGILAYCGSGYTVRPGQKEFTVFGTKGTIRWLRELQFLQEPKPHQVEITSYLRPVNIRGDHSVVEEIQEFTDAIRGKGKIEVDGGVAIRALAVVEAAIQSNKTGKAVNVKPLIRKYIRSL